jgi:hypothetical protein
MIAAVGRLLLQLLVVLVVLRWVVRTDTARTRRARHTVRVIVSVLLTLLGTPWGCLLLPAWLATVAISYLVYDPGINHAQPPVPTGSAWHRAWQVLTDREKPNDIWSAYLEALILVLNVAWFCYLFRS